MVNYSVFTVMITASILAPIVGGISILAIVVFERRLDLLKSLHTKLVLENELRQMRYMHLDQQIQPHFFFNTLNLLLSLARLGKTTELVHSLEQFSLFFRYSYQEKGPLIPIVEELKFTQNYLAIQQMRFGNRLKVSLDYPAELKSALIIPYMLQTLVENACKHGLENQFGDALLNVRFFIEGSFIRLEVMDNGRPATFGPYSDADIYPGQGLKNVRGRMELLFPGQAELDLRSLPDEGTCVTARWPLQFAQGEVEYEHPIGR